MKKFFFILFAISVSSIALAQKSMTFQADVANRNGDVIYIKDQKGAIIKEIKVDDKGIFKSTFDVAEGAYILFDGVEYTDLYLTNGDDLKLTMDAKQFDESIKYTGKGETENNYLAQATLLDANANYDSLLSSNQEDFNKKMEELKEADLKRLNNSKLDSKFVDLQKKGIENKYLGMKQYYKQAQNIKKLNNLVAPPFEYINFGGTKTKLEDFKGKYVYIDVWATWCGPCRGELPSLKIVEEKYKEKNIAFVSISVD